jgi:hypothetical protein
MWRAVYVRPYTVADDDEDADADKKGKKDKKDKKVGTDDDGTRAS